jgi:hypothetical protein
METNKLRNLVSKLNTEIVKVYLTAAVLVVTPIQCWPFNGHTQVTNPNTLYNTSHALRNVSESIFDFKHLFISAQ